MEEIIEDVNIKQECLNSLRDKISGEPNLYSRTDDEFLLRFIRARKFNTERAFSLLKNYYSYRCKHSDLFENISVAMDLFKNNFITLLPHSDSKGRKISVIRIGPCDPLEFPFPLGLQATILGLEKAIEDAQIQINGLILIVDLQGFSFQHVTELATPSALYKSLSFAQDSFPVRLKEVHIVFNPSIFSTIYTMLSPLIKRKLRKRIRFHGNEMSSLHSYVHPDLLPEEFGGTLGPIDNTEWCTILQEWRSTWDWNVNEFGYKKTANS